MDNFQQSLRNTSFPNRLNRASNNHGFHQWLVTVAPFGRYCGAYESRRVNATTREIEPLRSSVTRTAAAAEYVCEGAAETRE